MSTSFSDWWISVQGRSTDICSFWPFWGREFECQALSGLVYAVSDIHSVESGITRSTIHHRGLYLRISEYLEFDPRPRLDYVKKEAL